MTTHLKTITADERQRIHRRTLAVVVLSQAFGGAGLCDVSYLYIDAETDQSRERIQNAGNEMMRTIADTEWGNNPANASYLSVAGEILNNSDDPQRMESLENSLDDGG